MSENNSIKSIGLPEIYLSPSKKIQKKELHETDIWDDKSSLESEHRSPATIDFISGNDRKFDYSLPSKQKNVGTIKGGRGETPGSDSPHSVGIVVSLKNSLSKIIKTSDKLPNNLGKSNVSVNNLHRSSSRYKRRPIDGAHSNDEKDSMLSMNTSILTVENAKITEPLERNSPAGNSNENFLNNPSLEVDDNGNCVNRSVSKLVRPPALGQSEDRLQIGVFAGIRKDLGSSDGEDSSNESAKHQIDQDHVRTLLEGCSLGSQSENTDSTTTVLDMKREPVQGCEDEKSSNVNNICKPNFIVGGAISPRVVPEQKLCLLEYKRPDILHDQQEDSLNSMISAESTYHPGSSEHFTSPSVISVSSVASSKKLEWDSSADVGYGNKIGDQSNLASSLSTLERITIENYASVLRTDPEGKGTSQLKIKGNKKSGNYIKEKQIINKYKETQSQKFNFMKNTLNGKRGGEHNLYIIPNEKLTSSDDEMVTINRNSQILSGKISKSHLLINKSRNSSNHFNSNAHKSLKKIYSREKTKSLSNIPCTLGFRERSSNKGFTLSNNNKEGSTSGHSHISIASSSNSDTLVNSCSSLHAVTHIKNDLSVNCKENKLEKKQNGRKFLLENSSCERKNISLKNESQNKIFEETIDQNEGVVIPSDEKRIPQVTDQENIISSSNYDQTDVILKENSTSIKVLQDLAAKLRYHMNSLIKYGAIKKSDDYNTLQSYVDFVEQPVTSKEDMKLKQSIADVIVKLFGNFSDHMKLAVESNEENSHSSSPVSVNSGNLKLESEPHTGDEDKLPEDFIEEKEELSSSDGKVCYLPYKPSTVSKRYFVPAGKDWDSNVRLNEPLFILHVEQNWREKLSSSDGNSLKQQVVHKSQSDKGLKKGSYEEICNGEEKALLPTTSSNKAIYQDYHGTYHVAHQPPGYSSCEVDSQHSDSASDNEGTKTDSCQHNDENFNMQGLTSTGSESAYETIRERHRNVGETLASSFEFYSTSPRDARVLGYVSGHSSEKSRSEYSHKSERGNSESLIEESDVGAVKSSERENISSSSLNSSQKNKLLRRAKRSVRRNASPRKWRVNTQYVSESDDDPFCESKMQFPKSKYVRNIQKYISILEKLERNLIPSSDSLIASESNLSFASSSKQFGRGEYKKTLDSDSGDSSDCKSSVSNFVSSEFVDSSLKSLEDTFIEHRSFSNHEDRGDLLQPKIPTSSSLRRVTESQNVEKELFADKGSHIINKNIPVENFGHISDFKKLMASKNVPGEIRPYRFLIKQNRKVGLENFTEDFVDKGSKEIQPSSASSEEELKGLIRPSCKNEIEADNDSEVFNNNTRKIVQESLSSFEVAINDNYLSRPNREQISKTKEMNNFGQTFPTTIFYDDENYLSRPNIEQMSKTKEMKDFGQTFPTSLLYGATRRVSVSIQTGESLLILNEDDEIKSEMESFKHESETGISSPSPLPPPLSSSSSNVNSPVNHHISALMETDQRIKENAKKIEAALKAYNDISSKGDSSLQVLSSKSFSKEPLKLDFSTRKITQNEKSNINTGLQSLNGFSSSKEMFETYSNREVSKKSDDFVCKQAQKEILLSNESLENQNFRRLKESNIEISENKKSMKFTVVIDQHRRKSVKNKSLIEELIDLNKENEIMSLQDALSLARPSYVKEAEKRRQKICRKQARRRYVQAHNQEVMAELPDNIRTPSVLQKFLFKNDESPVFTYKAIRKQNQRLYQMLPEAQKPVVSKKKEGMLKTNRLMAKFYSQKLRRKVISGKVSHAHREVVTPVR